MTLNLEHRVLSTIWFTASSSGQNGNNSQVNCLVKFSNVHLWQTNMNILKVGLHLYSVLDVNV